MAIPRAGWTGPTLAAGVVLVAACFALSPISTTDFYWHLAGGEWILQHGTIPRTDPFSYTSEGHEWLDLHWGFQTVLALGHRLAGLDGLVLGRCALVCLLSVLLLRLASTAAPPDEGAGGATAAAVLLALLASQERFLLRPELPTYLLLTTTLLLLERHARGTVGRWIFLLPALMLLWANLHSLFVVGLAVIFLSLAGGGLDRLRHRKRPILADRRLAATLGLAALAALVNPFGLKAYALPLQQLMGKIAPDNLYSASISEVQSPFSMSFGATAVGAALILALLGGLTLVRGWRSLPSRYLLWFLALGWLAFRARRNLPLFALGTVPLVAAGLRGVARRAGPRVRIAGRLSLAALLGLLCFGITSNRLYLWDRTARRFGSGVMPGLAPAEALEFVLRSGPPGRLFHALADGGYVIWRAFPARQAFLDGRLEVHSEETFRNYLASLNDPAEFERLVGRWDIRVLLLNHVLAPTAGPLLHYLARSDEWVPAHFDATASVFVRAGAAPEIDLAALRPEELLARHPDPSPLDRVLGRLNPWRVEAPLTAARLGVAFARLGLLVQAETCLRAATVGSTLPPEVRLNLGSVLSARGRELEAREQYEQALATLRSDPTSLVLRRDLRRELRHRLAQPVAREPLPSGGAGPAAETARRREAGDLTGAIALYREALRDSPEDAGILLELGVTLLGASQAAYAEGDMAGAGNRLHEAETALAAATASRPDLDSAWYHLGIARLTLGDVGGAVEALQEATRRQPDRADYLHGLGTSLAAAGRGSEAVAALRRAVQADPGRAAAWLDLATAERASGSLEEARAALERCTALGLDDPAVFMERARVEAGLGRLEEARRWLDRVPMSPAERRALAGRAPELAPLLPDR